LNPYFPSEAESDRYQAAAGQSGAGTTAGNSGQLMSIVGTLGGSDESALYNYDGVGRLVSSSQTSNGQSAERRFAYDRWGNRTGVWDAMSGGNQIQSMTLEQLGGAPTNRIASVTDAGGTANYAYDAAGNVTNDGQHSYTYDGENRLVAVDGGATGQYSYDHQNRRYKKVVGSAVTDYVWEGSRVLAEHNASTGGVIADYVYRGGLMVAKVEGGATSYFLRDQLSVRLVLDASGNIVGRQGHLPFGEDFAESGSQEKHHFTSYERDAESGLDYAINRGYSPASGRFLSADAYRESSYMLDPQSWNRYSYTRNNPINSVDTVGLEDKPIRLSVTACASGGYPDPVTGECPFNDPFFKVGSFLDASGFADPRLIPPTPQRPPNPPVRQKPSSNNAKIFDKAKRGLLKRLKKKECADLFKNINPSSYLENNVSIGSQTYDGSPFSGGELTLANTVLDTDAKGTRLASGHTVFNQDSAFFTGTVGGRPFPGTVLNTTSSMYGLSLDEIRELAVLHELFHVNDVSGAYDDNTGDAVTDLAHTKAINKLIREKCGFR
jgi:RHS repeat-associated protein